MADYHRAHGSPSEARSGEGLEPLYGLSPRPFIAPHRPAGATRDWTAVDSYVPVDLYECLRDPDAQIEREVYAMIREYVWLVAGAGAALWVVVFLLARAGVL